MQILNEDVSPALRTAAKKAGFTEVTGNPPTLGKKFKTLFGIKMRAGKWAEAFLGQLMDGRFFFKDNGPDMKLFDTEKELIAHIQKVTK